MLDDALAEVLLEFDWLLADVAREAEVSRKALIHEQGNHNIQSATFLQNEAQEIRRIHGALKNLRQQWDVLGKMRKKKPGGSAPGYTLATPADPPPVANNRSKKARKAQPNQPPAPPQPQAPRPPTPPPAVRPSPMQLGLPTIHPGYTPQHQTPDYAFRVPILRAISEEGGAANIRDVFMRVAQIMKKQLTEFDQQFVDSSQYCRWQQAAQRERMHMIEAGLLKHVYQHGMWEITEAGRQYLARRKP